MKFTCRVRVGVSTPQRICVACGSLRGDSTATLKVGGGSRKQTIQLTFPVCAECDAARQRVGTVDSKRVGRGCLISLPIGVLGYFAYMILVARDPLSWFGTVDVLHISFSVWFGMLFGWVIAFVAVYLAFGKKLSRDVIDPHDEKVAAAVGSAVRITGYKPSSAWSEGEFTIDIQNPGYALEFQMANFAGISKVL